MQKSFKQTLEKVFVIVALAVCFMVNPFADVREDTLKNNTFISLSNQDKKDTITFVIEKVSKDLNIKNVPKVSFYKGGSTGVAAYNDLLKNTIFVNQDIFSDINMSTANGLTFESYLINILSHEVRHQYQKEHENDDTAFGKNCKNSYKNYIEYSTNPDAYYTQFVEADAYDYGRTYADNYIKNGYLKGSDLKTTFTARNGKKFDAVFYASKYPDVVAGVGSKPTKLLEHYNMYGIDEGRKPNANE